MRRFFVPAGTLAAGDVVLLTEPIAHRLSRVLRLVPGERVLLLEDGGPACEVELTRVAHESVYGRILRAGAPDGEPRTRLTLYQALLRADKWDWVLQKGTELGVARFVPLLTERTQVRLRARDDAKASRWAHIVREAAEQAGRARLPEIDAPLTLDTALAHVPAGRRLLMASVSPEAESLRRALSDGVSADVGLLIGPEGDFAPDEVARARARGAQIVSLGARVLRAETAPIAALAAILFAAGEM